MCLFLTHHLCFPLSVQAKNTHSLGDWYKVAQFMCYNTSTVDGFYVLNLNAKQVAEHRHLFESAVEGEETMPVKKVDTRKRPATSRAKRGKRPCQRAVSPSTSVSPSPSATLPRTKEGSELRKSALVSPSSHGLVLSFVTSRRVR